MGWLQTSYPRVPLGSTATVTLFTSLCSFCLSSFFQESACEPKKKKKSFGILLFGQIFTRFSFFVSTFFFGCEKKNKAGTQTNNPGAVVEHQNRLSLAAHHQYQSAIRMKLCFMKAPCRHSHVRKGPSGCLLAWASGRKPVASSNELLQQGNRGARTVCLAWRARLCQPPSWQRMQENKQAMRKWALLWFCEEQMKLN